MHRFLHWVWASRCRVCFWFDHGLRGLVIDTGTLCRDVICWPVVLTPKPSQLGGNPVGGLLVGEMITVSRCEVVIVDGRWLAGLGCFKAVVEEIMSAHVCGVKRCHGGDGGDEQ